MSLMNLWIAVLMSSIFIAGLFQIHSLDQEMSLYFISIYTWVNYEHTLATNKAQLFAYKGLQCPQVAFWLMPCSCSVEALQNSQSKFVCLILTLLNNSHIVSGCSMYKIKLCQLWMNSGDRSCNRTFRGVIILMRVNSYISRLNWWAHTVHSLTFHRHYSFVSHILRPLLHLQIHFWSKNFLKK